MHEAANTGRSLGWQLVAVLLSIDLWLNIVRMLVPDQYVGWLHPAITAWALAQAAAVGGYLIFGRLPWPWRLAIAVGILSGGAECCYLYAPYWPKHSLLTIVLRGLGLMLISAGWVLLLRVCGWRLRPGAPVSRGTGDNPLRFSLTQYFALMTAWGVLLAFSRNHWSAIWAAANPSPWFFLLGLLAAMTMVATLLARSLAKLCAGLLLAMILAPVMAGDAIGIGVAVLFVYCGLVALLTSLIWRAGWRGHWQGEQPREGKLHPPLLIPSILAQTAPSVLSHSGQRGGR
jgi:hypothetical protein